MIDWIFGSWTDGMNSHELGVVEDIWNSLDLMDWGETPRARFHGDKEYRKQLYLEYWSERGIRC